MNTTELIKRHEAAIELLEEIQSYEKEIQSREETITNIKGYFPDLIEYEKKAIKKLKNKIVILKVKNVQSFVGIFQEYYKKIPLDKLESAIENAK